MDKRKKLLIIGFVWPEPNSTAAGGRMMNLISYFQGWGYEITFASSATKTPHMESMEELGIATVAIEINDSGFDDFIQDLEPSVVLFDRFMTEEQFGWRVAEHCPGAVRILDTEDLHCLRRARHMALKSNRDFKMQDLLAEETTVREIASIYRCDLSLIISEFEMNLLTGFFDMDADLLCYLPFDLPKIDDKVIGRWPPFSERSGFVTIGNFRHAPNWDAVRVLRSQVWSQIRQKLPQAELHIYGSYVTQKAKQLHKPEEGFFIKGRAESAEKVVRQARVALAPLRFGAGLKGKLVEAMQCGTPSITTGIGAEGIAGPLEWSGIIAKAPEEIAQAAAELYRDESLWKKKQKQGIRIINQRFADQEHKKEFMNRLAELRENPEIFRKNNFTGQMLLHHTMASTKFMSRWIEEKNRDS